MAHFIQAVSLQLDQNIYEHLFPEVIQYFKLAIKSITS